MKSKVISLLLSFVVAFGLWLYVVTVVSPDSRITIRNIPVELEGEKILHENGLMVIKNETPTIDLQLEGNRSDLIKLNKSNITVTVDVTKIDSEGTLNAAYDVRYPGDIPANAISIHSQDPGMVRLVVEKRVTKYVDVTIKYTGTLPEGYVYRSDEVDIDFPKIPIVGAKSVVDKVTQAMITVDLSGQKNTINKEFAFILCDKSGQPVETDALSYDISAVRVTVPVMYSKQVEIEPNIIPANGASAENVEITPKKITIYGPKSILDATTKVELSGSIDLGDYPVDTEIITKVMRLGALPSGVSAGVDSVTVTIKFPDIITKSVSIDLDSVDWNPNDWNTTKGYDIRPNGSKKINIEVRGTKELVESLDSQSFVITVITNGINESTKSVDIRVEITGELQQPELAIIESPESLSVTVTKTGISAA